MKQHVLAGLPCKIQILLKRHTASWAGFDGKKELSDMDSKATAAAGQSITSAQCFTRKEIYTELGPASWKYCQHLPRSFQWVGVLTDPNQCPWMLGPRLNRTIHGHRLAAESRKGQECIPRWSLYLHATCSKHQSTRAYNHDFWYTFNLKGSHTRFLIVRMGSYWTMARVHFDDFLHFAWIM